MPDAPDITRRLFSLSARGIKFGLDKINKAALRLADPQAAYPCFHAAGTNGKGSACAYLESALRRYGHTTGLFMSPHLVDFEERFLINGRPVPQDSWMAVYRDTAAIIEELKLTFFEATALMAFELFKREKVTFAVFEVGMGGRLDATNIVAPRVSVITPIDFDHREFLGNDLISIAREKLGIVKSGVPVIMAAPAQQDVREEAERVCRAAGSRIRFVDGTAIESGGARVAIDGRTGRIVLPLRGRYQAVNAACALAALEQAGFTDAEKNAAGIAGAYLPGRFQAVNCRGKTVVFDAGHNPQAADVLVQTLEAEYPGQRVLFVTGIMKDKEHTPMVRRYSSIASGFIFVLPHTERAAAPEDLAAHVPAEFKGTRRIVPEIRDAADASLSTAAPLICICGSFYTVGEAMTALGIKPYPD
jgi:dihydrofolate synthase/folylpolyglutamate synthase